MSNDFRNLLNYPKDSTENEGTNTRKNNMDVSSLDGIINKIHHDNTGNDDNGMDTISIPNIQRDNTSDIENKNTRSTGNTKVIDNLEDYTQPVRMADKSEVENLNNTFKSMENTFITAEMEYNKKLNNMRESIRVNSTKIHKTHLKLNLYTLALLVLFAAFLLLYVVQYDKYDKKIKELENYYTFLINTNNTEIVEKYESEEEDSSSAISSTEDTKKEDHITTEFSDSEDAASNEASKEDSSTVKEDTKEDEEEVSTSEVTDVSFSNPTTLNFNGTFDSVDVTENSDGTYSYVVKITDISKNETITMSANNVTESTNKLYRQYQIVKDINKALINTGYTCNITLETYTETHADGTTSTNYCINNYKGVGR